MPLRNRCPHVLGAEEVEAQRIEARLNVTGGLRAALRGTREEYAGRRRA